MISATQLLRDKRLTFKRYSTARSGLLNAALIARSICDLSKPMLIKFVTAAARSAPTVKAEGSLNPPPSVAVVEEVVDAGVGVEGTISGVGLKAGAGAAGGPGVEAIAGAGVEGSCAGADAAEEDAGAVLG